MDYIIITSKKYGKNESRGKYWPRFLLRYLPEANTVRALFYAIKQRQILAAHSSFLHPLNLVGELLLDVDLGICLLEVFLSKPEQNNSREQSIL
jgi:hypothetical protein